MIYRSDYINGVRGVLDVFQEDPKTPEFWEERLSEASKNVARWIYREPHLYSWHLGRFNALRDIHNILVFNDLD